MKDPTVSSSSLASTYSTYTRQLVSLTRFRRGSKLWLRKQGPFPWHKHVLHLTILKHKTCISPFSHPIFNQGHTVRYSASVASLVAYRSAGVLNRQSSHRVPVSSGSCTHPPSSPKLSVWALMKALRSETRLSICCEEPARKATSSYTLLACSRSCWRNSSIHYIYTCSLCCLAHCSTRSDARVSWCPYL